MREKYPRMFGHRPGQIFIAFVFAIAAAAFIPNPAWFAGTFAGWLVFGGLLVAGQMAMLGHTRTIPVVSALLLSTLVLGSEFGLPMETGLPMLAIAAVLASQSASPRSMAPVRALALVIIAWMGWAIWGWCVHGIFPAESRWGFIKHFSPEWPGECEWPRLEWPLGNANPMAGLLLMLVPLGIALTIAEAKAKLWRTPWAVATIAAAGLLAACGSRAGLLAPVIAGLAYLIFLPASRLRTGIKLGVGGGALAALGGFIAISPTYRHLLMNPESKSYSDQVRKDFAETGLNIVKANPLTGIGAGGVPAHYAAYLSSASDQPGCHQLHSTPLQWMAEFGVFGGLLWIGLAVLTLLALRRAACATESRVLRGGAAVAATAYLVFSLFDYQLYLPVTAFVWGACIGLAWRDIDPKPASDQVRRILVGATCLVVALTAWRIVAGTPSRYHAWRASALLAANDTRGALDRLGLAMNSEPDSPVYPAVAATLVATLPTEDAQAAAQNRLMADALLVEARRRAPDFPYLTALQGWLWVDADPAKAVTLFHEALRRSPKLPVAWQGLARAYGRQGRLDDAVTALALNGMITPEDLFSPALRTGFYNKAASRVFARFRKLTDAYEHDFAEDHDGYERLTIVRRQIDAWEKSGECVRTFVQNNPTWSSWPQWRHLASVEMIKGVDGLYPVRSRMIMSAALNAVTGIEAKDGHAVSLLDSCTGCPGGASDARILRSQETFAGFGLYFGNASMGLCPLYSVETDLLSLLYVYENDPLRPHLRADFFLRCLSALPSSPVKGKAPEKISSPNPPRASHSVSESSNPPTLNFSLVRAHSTGIA